MTDLRDALIDRIAADGAQVDGMRAFLSDEGRALQAYLSFRNEVWESPEGRDVCLGWIGCSTIVGRMRGLSDEPKAFWWMDHERGVEPSEVETAEFLSMMGQAGWRRKEPGERAGPDYFTGLLPPSCP